MTDPILKVENLKKHYSASSGFLDEMLGRSDVVKAVDGCSLEIYEDEMVGLVGESGSGKSTLGETMIGLQKPTSGNIYFKGEKITNFSKNIRKEIQIIFQDPFEALNPMKTVDKLLSEPINNFEEYFDRPEHELKREILHDVGLRPPESFLSSYPQNLSGGELQRVGIARALILEPSILIADEPMSMVDVSTQSGIIDVLERLQQKYGLSILYITHDLSLVQLVSEKLYVMYRGKIVEQGNTDKIVNAPKHPYAQALLSAVPDLSSDRQRVEIPPKFTDDTNLPNGCNFHPRCGEKFSPCDEHEPDLYETNGRKVKCFLYSEDHNG
jgi:peptide/nickel transport system ATP-binding protein